MLQQLWRSLQGAPGKSRVHLAWQRAATGNSSPWLRRLPLRSLGQRGAGRRAPLDLRNGMAESSAGKGDLALSVPPTAPPSPPLPSRRMSAGCSRQLSPASASWTGAGLQATSCWQLTNKGVAWADNQGRGGGKGARSPLGHWEGPCGGQQGAAGAHGGF
jgi:hypothetical protein